MKITRRLALCVIALLTLSDATRAQTPAAAIDTSCEVTDRFQLPASSRVPVVATYMQNRRLPNNDVERAIPKARLREGFASDGEFNKVWKPHGIEFALVAIRTCRYAMASNFDPDPRNPLASVPNPDISFHNFFLSVLRANNTRQVRATSGEVEFRGLDLYLWWDIDVVGGYAVRPRFGARNETARRLGDPEPPDGRPGAVWLGADCAAQRRAPQTDDICAGLFAHEAGHFLGLCHCCLSATPAPEQQRCMNHLKTAYCPGLGMPDQPPARCGSSNDFGERLMSATNPHLDPRDIKLLRCEVETAKAGARKVLQFGANGNITQSPGGTN